MKKNNIIKNSIILIILTVILPLVFSFNLLKVNRNLDAKLSEKRKELIEAEDTSRRLDKLEREDKDIMQKQEALYRQVPNFSKKLPFDFIRTLIQAGTSAGLKEIKINIVHKNQQLSSDSFIPIRVELTCKGVFSSLLVFFEKLAGIERIINVDMLRVEREETSLPSQKIYLQLIVYTFPL